MSWEDRGPDIVIAQNVATVLCGAFRPYWHSWVPKRSCGSQMRRTCFRSFPGFTRGFASSEVTCPRGVMVSLTRPFRGVIIGPIYPLWPQAAGGGRSRGVVEVHFHVPCPVDASTVTISCASDSAAGRAGPLAGLFNVHRSLAVQPPRAERVMVRRSRLTFLVVAMPPPL